jgi:hypothetical protein
LYSKIWAPFQSRAPLKKFFRKAKFFPENVGDGGGVDNVFRNTEFPKIFRKQHFSRNFQRTNPSFFKNFAILPCQGPLPASWAPLFYFFGGCYTPHTPRPQVARPCELLRTALDNQSLLYNILLKSINPYSIYYVMTAILCSQNIFCQTCAPRFLYFVKHLG